MWSLVVGDNKGGEMGVHPLLCGWGNSQVEKKVAALGDSGPATSIHLLVSV
jgi:hypothetical protein